MEHPFALQKYPDMKDYIRPKTKGELADEYKMERHTFSRLLRKNQLRFGRGLLTPKQIFRIYTALGFPNTDIRIAWQRWAGNFDEAV